MKKLYNAFLLIIALSGEVSAKVEKKCNSLFEAINKNNIKACK